MKSEDKCNVNAKVFKNAKTPEVAYILGLLWADGHIRVNGFGRTVILEMVDEDAQQLIPIFESVGKWHYDIRKRKNRKSILRIMATNRYLYDYLYSLDYSSKSVESADKVLTSLPSSIEPYWWRGYFDGDGCIYINKNIIQLYFSGPYNQKWNFLSDKLKKMRISFAIKKRKHISKKGKISRSSFVRSTGRFNAMKFYKYIYANNLNLGILRKLNKFRSLEVKNGQTRVQTD